MNSEKVKEIKKALEVYGNENKGITILRGGEIQLISYADILTLINELEKEKIEIGAEWCVKGWEMSVKEFTERLTAKSIRRQEFIGELVIDDIEYVKVKDIYETLKEFIDGTGNYKKQ